ncbi:MAG TPA: inositol monophosphatase [Phaeodactylibacter sp.]|nr:inositol monophosphatase [Phaeodactylibacter sp.]
MNSLTLEKITKSVAEIAAEVAEFIESECGKVQRHQIDIKSLNSLVSYVDRVAEQRLVGKLRPLIRYAAFLTEEETIAPTTAPYRWIIDPLDGTTNFLHQLPFFSISIALQENEQTVMGIVYEVNSKECFYAWKGGGAFLNGEHIYVSDNRSLSNALLATGFPYHDYSRSQNYLDTLDYLMRHSRGIRRFGSAALDLAYVACGRFDAFYEYSLHAWDVAAGAFIVEEAGGKVCDFKGGRDFLFGKEIIAGSDALWDEISTLLIDKFTKS